jgi:chromosome segregation ATPase
MRRGTATLVLLVAAAVAGGGAGIAVQQRQVADAWRDRAVAVEAQRDEAIGRAEALGAQLDELGELARLADADLSDLEARLTELAEEKARVEDRAVVTRAELESLASRTADASRQLDRCVTDLIALQTDTIAAFNRLSAGERVDVEPLNARLIAVREVCAAARQAGAAAAALAASLR